MTRGIVVLGMHRSGTSALTRTLNLLGLALRHDQLVTASPDNPKGFWEYEDVVRSHELFFWEAGFGHYGPVGSIDADLWTSPARAVLDARLSTILRRGMLSAPVWVLKDPRLCRLLPVWLPLLERNGVEASFILMARNPSEVAASLRARDELPEDLCHWYWIAHLLDAELLTRPHRRVLTTYDALMRDWRASVSAIARGLELDLSDSAAHAASVDDFLDAELRHHVLADEGDDGSLERQLSGRLWQAMKAAPSDSPDALRRTFDEVRAEWTSALSGRTGKSLSKSLEGLRRSADAAHAGAKEHAKERAELRSKLAALEQALRNSEQARQAVEQALRDTEQQLHIILTSKSWRMTAPLRDIRARLRHS